MEEQRYNKGILLLSTGNNSFSMGNLAPFVSRLQQIMGESIPEIIIHGAILSLEGSLPKGIALWSAGYAGAAIDILTPAETERERNWGVAVTRSWKPERYFPLRLRRDQARQLVTEGTAVCLGYQTPPVPGQICDLILSAESVLHSLPARYLPVAMAVTTAPMTDPGSPPTSVLHVVADSGTGLPGDEATVIAIAKHLAALEWQPPREVAELPVTGIFHSGLSPFPGAAEPAVISALLRTRRAVVDRDRSVLKAAAGRHGVSREAIAPAANQADRELQGGISGISTMEEGALRVSFAAGRIASIAAPYGGREAAGGPVRRAQGYLRRSGPAGLEQTSYLETFFAAWFTGDRARGIEERAILEGQITIDTSAMMLERFPGLLLGQRVSVPAVPPERFVEASLFEISLYTFRTTDALAVTAGVPGGSSDHFLIPPVPGEYPVTATSVLLEIPDGAVMIVPATDEEELAVPFRFAVTLQGGVPAVVFRTLPGWSLDPWPDCTQWSTSWVFGPGSCEVEALRLPMEALGEVPGFSSAFPDEEFRRTL